MLLSVGDRKLYSVGGVLFRCRRTMVVEVNTHEGTTEVPTATEFIPADEVPGANRTGKPMVRGLQRVRDGKGLEVAYHEPHDDSVENHVFICDECGHDEATEDGIEHHLRTEHEG